jgi:DNA-binding beta-propeller fold protein YncE
MSGSRDASASLEQVIGLGPHAINRQHGLGAMPGHAGERNIMTRRIHGLTMAAALATVVVGGNAFAAGMKLLTTIDIPGEELKLFDIGTVDAATGRYYIADRSNKGVDIFDTKTNKYVGRVEGFVGVVMKDGKPVGSASGPNGVAVDKKTNTLWATDGDSTIKVVDLKTNKIIDTIKTGGTKRSDELAIDSKNGIVLAFNNADKPTFGVFISTKPDHKILGKVEVPEATDGVEQSVYIEKTGLFYSSVPEWKEDNKQGGVAVFDPKTMKMLRLINIPDCQPTGLMQGPGTNMLVGCAAGQDGTKMTPATVIWDWKTEKVVSTVKEVGGMDEVWYDSGTNQYYTASRGQPGGPVLGVIDAKTNKWIENVPTAPGAHSVAADSKTKHAFVPLTANPSCPKSCIGVYGLK